ncbi:MAG TPA: TIGR01459 family HAD-type hydrolase [Alphaproteobacteria bacterium]|mgnify:CR=1 FL=1|nr:TIGR01459 family HAD-type hydrolase [Alphaproteobacteria bacterium]USO06294.1 MAG: TIGR01459 family HAD-type hydrolase [Rhodospirillales bacterium]HOO81100.1 TIGR01459 family HAD-type hydrolase [Alphaproteobacteria bacterium]
MNTKTKFCNGISDISDSYAGFIIDQWGVLHDGHKPYDGVVDCLKELKSRKKHIIILSNSGKRAEANKERLKKIGIGPSLYDQIVTSGEITWQGIDQQNEGFFIGLGKKVYVISRGGDRSIVDGLDIEVVGDPAKADFLIISGSDAPDKTLEDYEPTLKSAARKGLTALCANPDSRGVMGSQSIMGPGTLARRYQDFGGVVHYIGKPHQPIFKHCIRILQEKEIYPGQTIVIGDALAHDILGGDLVNIDTCLVKTGLHTHAFEHAQTPASMNKALILLSHQFNNVRPTYLVESLKWGNPLPDRKHKKRAAR